MCCGTISDSNIFSLGLVNDHAYSLVNLFIFSYKYFNNLSEWLNSEILGVILNGKEKLLKKINNFGKLLVFMTKKE